MSKRGRFAPTPSGRMHLGNARTALLAWLHMRQAGGQFVLRIEDIDKPRSRPEFARQILSDLRWLGLDWDEGPDVGGPYTPYVQSAREERYAEALQQLADSGRLYPCYCSRAELAALAGAPHGLASEGPVYPGTCRRLTDAERAAKAAAKMPSLRFQLPGLEQTFQDGAAGRQVFPPGAGGDFVVQRADGIFSYQLAVVVDDAAMRITDVLRGADLLDSTPRQLFLYDALGLTPPRFAHVPLLYGPDGERLSKRHGAVAIAEMRQNGLQAEWIIGCLAYFSGLIAKPEPVKAAELVGHFSLSLIPSDPVSLDESTLCTLMGG